MTADPRTLAHSVSSPRTRAACAGSSARLIEPLTQRELEILALLCDGASNSEIGARVGVALPTVKFHVYQIFGKLGVLRRTQAVAVAIHLQLVRTDWLQPS